MSGMLEDRVVDRSTAVERGVPGVGVRLTMGRRGTIAVLPAPGAELIVRVHASLPGAGGRSADPGRWVGRARHRARARREVVECRRGSAGFPST